MEFIGAGLVLGGLVGIGIFFALWAALVVAGRGVQDE